jgi:2',3'-cyclic-nucleotide 2'-phosphodiesterase (5'-nucleotidase family)
VKRFGRTGWWIASLAIAITACNTTYVATEKNYTQYGVNKDSTASASAEQIISPYRDSLTNKMNVVIGTSEKEMTKAQPESELGNFCADAFLSYVKTTLRETADACIINYGGIRLPSLPKGEITVGKIFELLPFDNLIVVNTVSGDSLQKACDAIAKAGGWPVSGIRFKIVDGKAVDVNVDGIALVRNKNYNIVLSDYVANGGDNMFMLKSKESVNTNVLMRDAMMTYIRFQTQPLSSKLDQRIAVQ